MLHLHLENLYYDDPLRKLTTVLLFICVLYP